MKNIAIFASGSGTNTAHIIKYFENNQAIHVSMVLSNKKDAYVLERAASMNVKTIFFSRDQFYSSDEILNTLKQHDIDFVVLAGFLWLVPDNLLAAYRQRILNIHPALLPAYGGKGMYGMKVHESVKNNGDKKTGITIHYVNETYDDGQIIFQAECPVFPDDTPEDIAGRVHELEYKYYPEIINKILMEKLF
ncbi:MAG: phosphoribosylglycinamide formyltransferase [Bacteroidia bacterium]|nr:phosphoribosylglycinamide formyltransferase [Bacteroidia bacterium]